MLQNPLFPDANQPAPDPPRDKPAGYLLAGKNSKVINPIATDEPADPSSRLQGANPAANLIRAKLASLYTKEPAAQQEIAEVEHVEQKSPHQRFMYELSTSGRSLAEIQAEWHRYYTELPDEQKHEVWREFYQANGTDQNQPYQPAQQNQSELQPASTATAKPKAPITDKFQTIKNSAIAKSLPKAQELKKQVTRKVQSRAAATDRYRQHFHSLLFGLATGTVVLVVVMFGFFNQVILTPFIQPGRASSAPIIIENSSVVADATPKVIIPKINVEIPVVYNLPNADEDTIQQNLENGVIHYPGTVLPGQNGNAAFFGHSSNNIFNKGKYKFAFVLLHELRNDDVFYLTYGGKVYGYKVISRTIVQPTDVGVLGNVPGQTATATLITCDPPGTSLHRLVVVGKQISPDPSGNSAGQNTSSSVDQLTGNGPSLWSRIWNGIF